MASFNEVKLGRDGLKVIDLAMVWRQQF